MKQDHLGDYLIEVQECLSEVSSNIIISIIETILAAAKSRNNIFIIGNGGSASIASHFATDLVKSASKSGLQLNVSSLTDNIALYSATSNDEGFENVFSWQLEQFANRNDLLIAISSSGNSTNIVNAINTALKLEMKTISFSGFDGGKIALMSDVSLVTKSESGNYGPVEDAHSILCHYLARQIRNFAP